MHASRLQSARLYLSVVGLGAMLLGACAAGDLLEVGPRRRPERSARRAPDAAAFNNASATAAGPLPAFRPQFKNPRGFTIRMHEGGGVWEGSEITPFALAQPGTDQKLVVIPSVYSRICATTANITQTPVIDLQREQCQFIALPALASAYGAGGMAWIYPPDQVNPSVPWRLAYNGTFGGALLNGNLVLAGHGESENTDFAGVDGSFYVYQQRLKPEVEAHTCRSGWQGLGDEGIAAPTYGHCWRSFLSFGVLQNLPYTQPITWDGAALRGLTQPLANDEGPVFWSSKPYTQLPGGDQIGTHSTLFKDDGFVYVLTQGPSALNGQWCALAARAPIPASGPVDPHAFRLLDANGEFTIPSLPDGYTKERFYDFLSTPGAAPHCLFPDEVTGHTSDNYLNVARLYDNGVFTGYYMIVYQVYEWQPAPGHDEYKMRISRDMVHWSAPIEILPRVEETGWGKSWFVYPTIMNRQGDDPHKVERCDFSILGRRLSEPGYRIVDFWVDIDGLPECPSTPAPPTREVKNSTSVPLTPEMLRFDVRGSDGVNALRIGLQAGTSWFYVWHDYGNGTYSGKPVCEGRLLNGGGAPVPVDALKYAVYAQVGDQHAIVGAQAGTSWVYVWSLARCAEGVELKPWKAGDLLNAQGNPVPIDWLDSFTFVEGKYIRTSLPAPASWSDAYDLAVSFKPVFSASTASPAPAGAEPRTPASAPAPAPSSPSSPASPGTPAPAPAPVAPPRIVLSAKRAVDATDLGHLASGTEVHVPRGTGVALYYQCYEQSFVRTTKHYGGDPLPGLTDPNAPAAGSWPFDASQTPAPNRSEFWIECHGADGQVARGNLVLVVD